jgi:hypothetical protein
VVLEAGVERRGGGDVPAVENVVLVVWERRGLLVADNAMISIGIRKMYSKREGERKGAVNGKACIAAGYAACRERFRGGFLSVKKRE